MLRKKSRVLIAAFLALLMVAMIALPLLTDNRASARSKDEINQELEEIRSEKDGIQSNVDSVKGQISDAEDRQQLLKNQISATQEEIDLLNDLIDTLDAQIAEKEEEIEKKQVELDQAEKELAQQYEKYKIRVRAMYEQGDVSYLEVLLGASDFGDFLSRLEIVNSIVDYDQQLVDELEAKKKEIEDAKKFIEDAKQAIEDDKAETEQKKAEVLEKQSQLEDLEKELVKEITGYEQTLAEYEQDLKNAEAAESAAQSELNALIAQQEQNTANNGGSTPDYSGDGFMWPTPGVTYITSYFGYRTHPITGAVMSYHGGTDIGASYGTPVHASQSGIVAYAGWHYSYGNYVLINHGGGISTLYAHNSSLAVYTGQSVSRGEVISYVGSTGDSTGPHLHFEFRINGSRVNALDYVPMY